MEEDFLKIGKILKERRTYLGYTQQEIADKLNVTKSAVSKWESVSIALFLKIKTIINILFTFIYSICIDCSI